MVAPSINIRKAIKHHTREAKIHSGTDANAVNILKRTVWKSVNM